MKKIVIAPHIDDDVLGCGGIIDSDTLTLYCGVDDFHIISKEDRLKEADAVRDFYKNKYILLENTKVNEYQPEEVYIPYPSYNQDHRVVYEAALIALRPHDNNHFVNKVLVYEQPHVFLWNNTHNINGEFKPNYFKPIAIDLKIAAYELMESQVREFRGTEDNRALAKLRGTQSNYQCAEAFQVVRCVE